jgi:uncharacterized protein
MNGDAGLRLFECAACGHVFQIARAFCPQCGQTELRQTIAIQQGQVIACTEVHTAPLGSPTGAVPYWIVLVRCAAGVTLMACSATPIAIGVTVQVSAADARRGPYFVQRTDLG